MPLFQRLAVMTPVQTFTDYEYPLFQWFPKRKLYCLVKRHLFNEFFKHYYLKVLQNTVNLCF